MGRELCLFHSLSIFFFSLDLSLSVLLPCNLGRQIMIMGIYIHVKLRCSLLFFHFQTTTAHSSFDMRFGDSDENNKEATTSTSTSNILTVSTGTNTGNNRPGNSSSSGNNNKGMSKKVGKRPGRKPAKIDERAKLERSRQSAKECRARKKLRYQYLEELVLNREKAVLALRDELETVSCLELFGVTFLSQWAFYNL